MEETKKNGNVAFAIALLVILVIATGMIIYIVYFWDKGEVNNTTDVENINVTNYLEITDIDYSDYSDAFKVINIRKIILKNLDANIIDDYANKQLKLLANVSTYHDLLLEKIEVENYEKNSTIESNILYQINNNILSIYYAIKNNIDFTEAENLDLLTYNVDLENNKTLTYEEILTKYNLDKEKLAIVMFDNLFNENYNSDNLIDALSQETVTKEIVVENREQYIKRIENEIENISSLYISNNIIHVVYKEIDIETLCFYVQKEGPFAYTDLIIS